MKPNERFTRAVMALPGSVRERLDADDPLDWNLLEDAGTGALIRDAARAYRRLPEPVELLVRRLIREVGIMPADVAAGVERESTASAWIHRIAIEPEGESYRIHDGRIGEIHAPVRPEAVAGYATLALELAASIHDAVERWIEAGARLQTAAEGEPDHLEKCAIEMRAQLRPNLSSQRDSRSSRGKTALLANTLELIWNAQSFEARAALSTVRLGTGRGARAPSENHYAPMTGYRLHAYSLGETRWLEALGARAAADASTAEKTGAEASSPTTVGRDVAANTETVGDAAVTSMLELEARIQAAVEEDDTVELGSDPESLALDAELAKLGRAANRLHGAVRRRLSKAHGIDFSQALARFQDPEDADAARSEIAALTPGQSAPPWLKRIAATMLLDSGAQTRNGLRTASMRLELEEQPEGVYAAVDVETGARGRLSLTGLVEQIHLGLSFAQEVWTGLTMLGTAGREGTWALNEGEAESREFTAKERETLEAARRIERALDRARREYARTHDRAADTIAQASMAADSLAGAGQTVRAAAGWPDEAEAPDARNPEDISRIATVADALCAEIRSIANHFIAGNIASTSPNRESRRDTAAATADPGTDLRPVPDIEKDGRPDSNPQAAPESGSAEQDARSIAAGGRRATPSNEA